MIIYYHCYIQALEGEAVKVQIILKRNDILYCKSTWGRDRQYFKL